MSSQRKIDSARANGAKSRGPVTSEGGRASAASVVLPCEASPAFTELLAGLQEEFQPETASERRLVEVMAVADWRRGRLWCLEMAQYVHAVHKQKRLNDPLADQENAEIPSMHTALAFTSLSDESRALELLNRYEVRYSREYHRTLLYLKALRREHQNKRQISKRSEPDLG